jgi:hypothetical protein
VIPSFGWNHLPGGGLGCLKLPREFLGLFW